MTGCRVLEQEAELMGWVGGRGALHLRTCWECRVDGSSACDNAAGAAHSVLLAHSSSVPGVRVSSNCLQVAMQAVPYLPLNCKSTHSMK